MSTFFRTRHLELADPMTDKINIRLAKDNDLEAILKIWINGIENSFDISTTDLNIAKKKFKENFDNRQDIFNFWVAVDNDDRVIGWQSLIKTSNNPFRENIYAESSTYIDSSIRYKGLGQTLLEYVIKAAEETNLEYIIGFVAKTNKAARKITSETGWIEIGEIPPSGKTRSNYSKLILIRTLK